MKYFKIVAFFEKKSNSDLPSIWYFYRVNEFRPNTVEPCIEGENERDQLLEALNFKEEQICTHQFREFPLNYRQIWID